MNPLILTAGTGLAAFLLISCILSTLTAKRSEVSKRIKALGPASDIASAPKTVRKKKRLKQSAAAKTKKQFKKLENEFYDTGIKMPVQQFMTVWILSAFLFPMLMLLLGINKSVCAAAAPIVAAAPVLIVKTKKKKRRAILETQLTEAISVLCNALKAGHSFQTAMNSITQEMDGPIAEEFGRVFRETQHGMTMEDSMTSMVERTGSDDLEMLCTAILIQREVGGNLAEVLFNISSTIQKRLNLKKEIKTRTASGRVSGIMIGALPILILVGISVINPGYSGPLFTTDAGRIMLAISAFMEITGFIVINKIVSIKY